ncbi:MAG: glycosyltransferase, partial [Clostridiales bacterium]|nr:glycosyltransferase [Clostridiales bacterium]
MADVTAIVLTLNEEKNIGECLRSVAGFCRRVVVVDSGSTDRTL